MSHPLSPSYDSAIKRIILLILKIFGGIAWVAAYSIAINETRRSSRLLLPRAAIAANLTWESVYSLGGAITWRRLSLEDRVQTVINSAWLISDLSWTFAIGDSKIRVPRHMYVIALIYQLCWLPGRRPGDAARRSALVQNMLFSVYCALTSERPASDQIRNFTVLRAIGTAVPTLTSGLMRGYRPEYLWPGVVAVAFDIANLLRK